MSDPKVISAIILYKLQSSVINEIFMNEKIIKLHAKWDEINQSDEKKIPSVIHEKKVIQSAYTEKWTSSESILKEY